KLSRRGLRASKSAQLSADHCTLALTGCLLAEQMRYCCPTDSAQILGHADLGVGDLICTSFATKLQHHLDGLIYPGCAEGISTTLESAEPADRDFAAKP